VCLCVVTSDGISGECGEILEGMVKGGRVDELYVGLREIKGRGGGGGAVGLCIVALSSSGVCMPLPRKFLNFRPSEITFGAYFGPFVVLK